MTSSDQRYWPSGFATDLKTLMDLDDDQKRLRLDEMYRRAAIEITAPALSSPHSVLMERQGQIAGFEARLQHRWRPALELFALLIEETRAARHWLLQQRGSGTAQSFKFGALMRLHQKADMTAEEVLALLRAGFATGALARWRTLHEVWVVSTLLSDADDDIAQRYLSHGAVEAMKAEEDYEATWEALGLEPPDWSADERERRRDDLAAMFGKPFLKDYGWAAPLFKGKPPRLGDLQTRAALSNWRGHYRMASHGVHANPRGSAWNLQGSHRVDGYFTSRSNGGLVDPAQLSITALSVMTVSLMAFASAEVFTDGPFGDQVMALLRQHTTLILQQAAIDALEYIDEEQEGEEEDMEALNRRAVGVLQSEPNLTRAEIAERLDLEVETLEEALEVAVRRGLLITKTTYDTPEADVEE